MLYIGCKIYSGAAVRAGCSVWAWYNRLFETLGSHGVVSILYQCVVGVSDVVVVVVATFVILMMLMLLMVLLAMSSQSRMAVLMLLWS